MKVHEIEGGALREGGAYALLSKESIGVLTQYFAVGLIYGTLPRTVVPFMIYYLNMEGTQTASANALFNFGWSIKVFIGMISDCFPIGGYRRRPYMVFGWILCGAMLFTMAAMPVGKPYFTDYTVREIKPEDYTPEQNQTINYNAPSTGGKYIIMISLATVGYLFAAVAADGMLVEYAQREPLKIRGRIQTAAYSVRYCGSILSALMLAFGMVSYDYGGDFDYGMTFPQLMLVLGIISALALPAAWYLIQENRSEAPILKYYVLNLWEFVQTRAAYQLIGYNFLSNFCLNFTYVAYDPITAYWVSLSNTVSGLSVVLGNVTFGAVLTVVGRYGLLWNWRTMTTWAVIGWVVLDILGSTFITWDIVRNEWFWALISTCQGMTMALPFIVSLYVIIELAGENNEGAVYGLLTSSMNLSLPFAYTLSKYVNAPFNISNEDIQNDSHRTRRLVTITALISNVVQLLALLFLPLLPRQKAETQDLIKTGGSSRKWGIFTLVVLTFALIWSNVVNVLSVFESTSCLVIAGGDGCYSE